MRPKGSQVAQDGPEMTQDALRWPQGALGKSKDGPGWPQGKAWRAQDGHKGAQDGPKRAPRRPLFLTRTCLRLTREAPCDSSRHLI